jgi:mitotic spindle assembly checkpoint protein MAD1
MFSAQRLTFTAIYRANNGTAESSPLSMSSKTPISVTKSLSDLRLAHARLFEEHGANVALLRLREAEIRDLEQRESEAQVTAEALQTGIRLLREKVVRREQRIMLAEREVGFLNALVVLTPFLLLLRDVLIVVHIFKASFNSEEANREGAILDLVKSQRIQQLETLLQEFKDTNAQLTREIDALGGDSTSLGPAQGRNREALSIELEQAQQAKLELQKCTVLVLTDLSPGSVLIISLQPWKPQKPTTSNILRRLSSLNNPFSSSVGKLVRGDMSPQACAYCH